MSFREACYNIHNADLPPLGDIIRHVDTKQSTEDPSFLMGPVIIWFMHCCGSGKLYGPVPDPTFHVVPDPDPTLPLKFRPNK
jgi:hypothetical protein